MEFSVNQEAFLRELVTTGDEAAACKKLGLKRLLTLDWEEDHDFKLKKKRCEKQHLENLEHNISRAALNALHEVLKHGDRTITNNRTNREVFDLEGNLHRLETRTLTQRTNPRPSWAIKQGIRLYTLQRLEENLSNSLSTLIDEGIIGEDIKDRILEVLDKNDEQIRNIFSGNVHNVEIDEDALARIQAMLLGE